MAQTTDITRTFQPNYIESYTGSELLAGCKNLQNKQNIFEGVICIDFNVILDISELKALSDYAQFEIN